MGCHVMSCKVMQRSWRARTRASKFKNAQNQQLIKREYVSGHFKHFKNLRAHTICARVIARFTITQRNFPVFLSFIMLSIKFLTVWYLIQPSMINIKQIRANFWLQHARARALSIGFIWPKTCIYKNRYSSLKSPSTPNFFFIYR